MIITKEIKNSFYILCQQSMLCMILKYNVHFSAGDYISQCRNLTFVINVAPFSTGKYNSWMEWKNLNESMSQCSNA